MIGFNNFLTEAKISAKNLEKAADIFKRLVEKNIGTKLYRFGGPRGFSEIKNGMGILYISPQGKAIRINYKSGEIESITLWDKFKINQPGDYTVDLGGLGLLQAGKKIIEVIRKPSVSKIPAYPELYEGYLTEAKRIAPAKFAELVQNNLPPSIKLNAVPWGVFADIALANDYQIPTVVRKTKDSGRGKKARFDLTMLLSGDDVSVDVDKPAKDAEPIYYIKVTSQDPNTKKFMSVKGDQKAENILKDINKTLNNPQPKKEMMDPDTLFGRMRNLTQVICRGVRNSLVIYGGAGIGKTFVVNQTIKDEGLKLRQDYFIIKGKITTSALYQMLFIHRDNKLLVFDDTDSCVGSTVVNTSIGDMPIEKLYEVVETMGYVGLKNNDDDQFVLKSQENIDILSVNSDIKQEMKKMNYIMKHKVEKEMYEITIGDKSVEITEDHSCVVLRDGKMISVKPKEITDGDSMVYIDAA